MLILAAAFAAGGAAGALPVGHDGRAPTSRRRPPSIGSSATRTPTAAGSTSTTPRRTRATPEYNEVRHAGRDDGPLPGRGGGIARRVALRRPGHRMGPRPGSSSATAGPRSRTAGRGQHRRDRPPGRRADAFAGRPPATRATTACCAGSAASSSRRPSRPARCSPPTTPARGRRSPASTPSTTRGRPTGPSPASTGPSRARAGARPPTGSAPTWRPRATTSRITGRRSPITGPPTAPPRPWSSPSAGADALTEDEADYAREQAELFGPRRGGSPSATGRGASWCGAATRPAAADTA